MGGKLKKYTNATVCKMHFHQLTHWCLRQLNENCVKAFEYEAIMIVKCSKNTMVCDIFHLPKLDKVRSKLLTNCKLHQNGNNYPLMLFATINADLTVANVRFNSYAYTSQVKLGLRPFNQH